MPEWLSGMTRNHVGSARAGSNPAVHIVRHRKTHYFLAQVDTPERLSGMIRNHLGSPGAGSNPAVHVFLDNTRKSTGCKHPSGLEIAICGNLSRIDRGIDRGME
ncbi:unnamed protein product [Dovyalis caffra]|uniref:Uncharacterized protein n=1 Tax=Dovyalis caffra TaxID=77055 RepID=A0AAV1QXX5_9ROSI|nr:unnamed protein product [Dovyalis caffra]